jgi:hypothetical protein
MQGVSGAFVEKQDFILGEIQEIGQIWNPEFQPVLLNYRPTLSENRSDDSRTNCGRNWPNFPENWSLDKKIVENNSMTSTKFVYANNL